MSGDGDVNYGKGTQPRSHAPRLMERMIKLVRESSCLNFMRKRQETMLTDASMLPTIHKRKVRMMHVNA